MAAAIVLAHMHGCRCGDCWLQAIGEMAGLHPCLSVAGAEVVRGAWGGEARAIARRRRDRAPPLIDGDKAHRLLNQPAIWKTVEAVTRVLLDGAENEGEEPEEIARLLKGAGVDFPGKAGGFRIGAARSGGRGR